MPLTRIKQTAIGADAITSPKLAHDLELDGDFVRVPAGTTAQRPSSAAGGQLRFNTDIGTLEQYNTATNAWQAIDSPPIITSLAIAGGANATEPAGGATVTLTGTNFKSGATVTIGGTSASSITVVSSTTITFTTPAKSAGDYDVKVTNTNGLAATLTAGLSYNGTPAFTTAAGNVGSLFNNEAMSTITIVAAEPDGGTLAFAVTSGALPSGVSLGSANGQLTGTPNPTITANTTFNFTVTATDDESQTNSRAFNLIVLRKIYNVPITRSLLLNDNEGQYIARTHGQDGNQQIWTWSGWVKRHNVGTGQGIFGTDSNAANNFFIMQFNSDNSVFLQGYSSSSQTTRLKTRRKFVDNSEWYHFVVAADTTQATASNRMKLYINGELYTDWESGSAIYPNAQNLNTAMNRANRALMIGAYDTTGTPATLDGHIADVHFIDGQQKQATDFANSYNDVWTPQLYTGTYGTNGFRLTFADSSDIGNDVSGNNNDFTGQALAVDHVRIDSPTTNFASLNVLDRRTNTSAPTTQNGLYVSLPGSSTVSGTQGLPSGKWYWEVKCLTNTAPYIGVQRVGEARGGYSLGGTALNRAGDIYSGNADLLINGSAAFTGNNHIVGVAYDADNDKIQWSVNGQWYTANAASASTETISNVAAGTTAFDLSHPGTGSGGLYASTGKITLVPYFGTSTAGTELAVNFGQNPTFNGSNAAGTETDGNGRGLFTYPVPSGYLACCAENIADDTDIDTRADVRPDDNFKCITWTGTGSARDLVVGFRPDLVWTKDRNGTYFAGWFDSMRGPTKTLTTSTDAAEGTYVNGLTSFNSDGFSWGTDASTNYGNLSGREYVGWCWKAGGAPTATNAAAAGAVPTSGSVMIDGVASTSNLAGTLAVKELSANTKAGFSMIRWTGAGADCTIAHGLNKKVEFFMTKSLSETRNWQGFHKNLSQGYILYFDIDYGQNNAGSTYFRGGYQASQNTNTTIGLSSYLAQSAKDMVGYAWHSVPGYSDIGYYVGTNNTDGPALNFGFKPAFLMVTKVGNGSGNGSKWHIFDNARDPVNNATQYALFADHANGDGVGSAAPTAHIHWTANGFKIINNPSGGINQADVYIYMAFASDPFKYTEAV